MINALGQNALHRQLGGKLPPPAVQSYLSTGKRHEREEPPYIIQFYPAAFLSGEDPLDHLRFALKNEPLDMGILYAIFQELITAQDMEKWVREEPTGSLSRRAWFLYEFLTGEQLNLPAAERNVPYVTALDPKKHYTAKPINSTRHRVRNNLLGGAGMCPTLRRTPRLETRITEKLKERAAQLIATYPANVLANAINYLYTRETRSSFEIENEKPTRTKEQRFLNALENIADFQPSKEAIIHLQNSIVDTTFAAHDWRDKEIFVGERIRDYEKVHFIGAKAADVDALMGDWQKMTERLIASPSLDPVLAASVAAFAFVFIHPFEDGNGRIHRYLMHYLLAQSGFTPPHVVFPISTAIVKQLPLYYAALETFSRPALRATEWEGEDDYTITIQNETQPLFRFFDATPLAEFLYDRVAETIDLHLQSELQYLSIYYTSRAALDEAFDMPNIELNRLTREILENGGRLSNNKRKQLFSFLTEEQVQQAEAIVGGIQAQNALPPLNKGEGR